MRVHAIAIILTTAAAINCAGASKATAQPSTFNDTRTIAVTGTGIARGTPDLAVVTIGVRNRADLAAAAFEQNSAATAKLITALKRAGIADRDLQTTQIALTPHYDYQSNRQQPSLNGYEASNSLRVRLRDISSVGNVIDRATKAGANQINGVQLMFSDPSTLQNKARTEAIADAKAKATLLAQEAGVNVGAVLSIIEGGSNAPNADQFSVRVAATESAAPIEAGEIAVRESVGVVFELK